MSNYIDLRTKAEKERDAKHQSIVATYTQLYEANKDKGYKPNRYINIVAKKYGMAGLSVRKILQSKGII